MKVALREISGPWDAGWVLDKHTLKSTYLGDDEYGHARFETLRSDVGEAVFQLKYRSDWDQSRPLAESIAYNICPKLTNIGFIVPMPASKARPRQPVTEVANELGKLLSKPVFQDILRKAPSSKLLKDVVSKDEKLKVLEGCFSVADTISNEGRWNVLLVDDLFDTGASMEEACKALRAYRKVAKIYVAALTWR